jgi:hypothetical protein
MFLLWCLMTFSWNVGIFALHMIALGCNVVWWDGCAVWDGVVVGHDSAVWNVHFGDSHTVGQDLT